MATSCCATSISRSTRTPVGTATGRPRSRGWPSRTPRQTATSLPNGSASGNLSQLARCRRWHRWQVRLRTPLIQPPSPRAFLSPPGTRPPAFSAADVSTRALPRRRWQVNHERCSVVRVWHRRKLSSVSFDDSASNRQSQAHAVGLGGEEGVEEPALRKWIQPDARVAHHQVHLAEARGAGSNPDLARAPDDRMNRLDGVDYEVQQYLLKLHAVAVHLRKRA